MAVSPASADRVAGAPVAAALDITSSGTRLLFSPSTGQLVHLGFDGGPNLLTGEGWSRSLDVRLRPDGWLGLQFRPELIAVRHEGGGIELTIRLGSLLLHDAFHWMEGRLARTIAVENPSREEVQLTGVRLMVPGISMPGPDLVRFEAPATAVRPRLPHAVVTRQREDRPWSLEAAPGAPDRWGRAMEDAPDVGPGLLALHQPVRGESLLVWYHSEIEAATPFAFGDHGLLTFGHELALAGWLAPGGRLSGGTQFLELHHGSWAEALASFQTHYLSVGILPPLYGSPSPWATEAAVYEAHPGPFGGFHGLESSLPRLAEMGFNVLYLMPFMRFDNRSGGRWDEDWLGSGSPYAMLDFEAIDPGLGTEADLKALVRSAHRLGIRVLLDFVAQGCALEARYVQEHPEWFCRDESGGLVSSHGWTDTYSLDWARPEYQEYMLDWALRWLRDFEFDGYRVDAPHGKEPNWDRALPYHASATNLGVLRLLERLQTGVKATRSDAMLLCELFGPVFVKSHDVQYDYVAYAMLQALLRGNLSPWEWGEWLRDYWAVQPAGALRLCFTETHDTRVGMNAYALRGSAAERAMFGLLVAAGFIPMVWAGQEEGWEDFYRRVLRARRESSALLRGARWFNAVPCSRPEVVSIVCQEESEQVWCVVSLYPERTPLRFDLSGIPGLPSDRLALRDLLTGTAWDEHGKTAWEPSELREVTISPRPFVPYFFRLTS